MRRASGPPRANFIWQLSPPAASTVGGISKCGDRRVRTLLYEAANVILTRSAATSGADCRHYEHGRDGQQREPDRSRYG